MPCRVLLVRHGDTPINKARAESAERIRSWLNVPMDAQGRQEALKVARKLRSTGLRFAGLYTSPLRRTQGTADAIAMCTGLSSTVTHGLLPWNMGELTGQIAKDVIPKMEALVNVETDTPRGGESFQMFRVRGLCALRRLMAYSVLRSGSPVIGVTHTRCLQLAKAWNAKGCPEDLSVDPAVMNDYGDEVPPGCWLEMPGAIIGGAS